MNGSAESSAQDRDAFSGVKIRFSPAGIAARRGARAPTRGCGGARSRDDRGDKCTRPLASFRRARVPLAMESARSSPTTRDGALASGTSAFQMGTGTPEARQQFVPRRSFAAHAPRSAPIFPRFRCHCDSVARPFRSRRLRWHGPARAPMRTASACQPAPSSTLRATSGGAGVPASFSVREAQLTNS